MTAILEIDIVDLQHSELCSALKTGFRDKGRPGPGAMFLTGEKVRFGFGEVG